LFDVDDLLGDLEKILLDVTRLAAERGGRAVETRTYRLGEAEVRTSVSIGFLDEMLPPGASRPILEREPVVDVIKTEEGLKVLVMLPGIAKDDVKVYTSERSLVFEINTRGRSYRKEIPLEIPPGRITIKSVVENNSVVEITFGKKRAVK
jgi:HSP20 family molecular chaperone IbpA